MYNNINEAARAHIAKLVAAGFTDPGYSSQIADTLMQISNMYESTLDSSAKASLPKVENYNSIPDVLFRCLEAARIAGASEPSPTLETFTVYADTAVGTYTAPEGKAYDKVVVSAGNTPAE